MKFFSFLFIGKKKSPMSNKLNAKSHMGEPMHAAKKSSKK